AVRCRLSRRVPSCGSQGANRALSLAPWRTSLCGLAESFRRGRDPFVCRGQGDAHVVTGCVTVELPRPSDDAEFRESSKGVPAVLPSSRPQVETGGRMIDAEPEVLETRAQLIPA